MSWYYFIYSLALSCAPISLINNKQLRLYLERMLFLLLLAILCLFAGLRSSGVDRDYSNYLNWFDWIAGGHLASLEWFKDPAFVLISKIVLGFGWNYVVVALIYAGLALTLKLYFSQTVFGNRWLPLFFYLIVCHTFLSGEMTEIRASVAIPIMSLSIILAKRGKRILAVFLFLLAVTFHLSSLIGLPVLILVLLDIKFDSRGWILSLIPISLIVMIALNGLLSMIADYGRIAPYLNGDVDTGSIHFLSIFLWVHVIILCVILTYFWKYMSGEEHLAAYCSSLGLCLLLVLHANDNLALRVSGIFGLFDLLLFMIPLKYMRGNIVRLAYVASLILAGFAFFLSSTRIVQPYQWIFT